MNDIDVEALLRAQEDRCRQLETLLLAASRVHRRYQRTRSSHLLEDWDYLVAKIDELQVEQRAGSKLLADAATRKRVTGA